MIHGLGEKHRNGVGAFADDGVFERAGRQRRAVAADPHMAGSMNGGIVQRMDQ